MENKKWKFSKSYFLDAISLNSLLHILGKSTGVGSTVFMYTQNSVCSF